MKKLVILISFLACYAQAMDMPDMSFSKKEDTQLVHNASGQTLRIEIKQTDQHGTNEVLSNLQPGATVSLTGVGVKAMHIVIRNNEKKLLSNDYTAADVLTIKKAENDKIKIDAKALPNNKHAIEQTEEEYNRLQVDKRISRRKSQKVVDLATQYSKQQEVAKATASARMNNKQPNRDCNHKKIDSLEIMFSDAKK